MPRPVRLLSDSRTNAVDGQVVWSPVRSIWFTIMAVTALVGCPLTASWSAFGIGSLLTVLTLCCGHSVGLHRLLIHRSFECSLWLERVLVSAGVLVGMGGPRKMMLMHEMRDWAQNQPACHPFYSHRSSILKDALWNLHCECRLRNPPEFRPEPELTESAFYRMLDRYWMAAQLPLAVLLYTFGGWAWVVWGVCGRVTISLAGHWFINYLAHNCGQQSWRIDGAAAQGFNLPGLGLLTMGESWHNNHHAFPDSARMGIQTGQWDPGWWLIVGMRTLGLVQNIRTPEQSPKHARLRSVPASPSITAGNSSATRV